MEEFDHTKDGVLSWEEFVNAIEFIFFPEDAGVNEPVQEELVDDSISNAAKQCGGLGLCKHGDPFKISHYDMDPLYGIDSPEIFAMQIESDFHLDRRDGGM